MTFSSTIINPSLVASTPFGPIVTDNATLFFFDLPNSLEMDFNLFRFLLEMDEKNLPYKVPSNSFQ